MRIGLKLIYEIINILWREIQYNIIISHLRKGKRNSEEEQPMNSRQLQSFVHSVQTTMMSCLVSMAIIACAQSWLKLSS